MSHAHLKSLAAPEHLGIPRKTRYWTTKSRPGPHPFGSAVPLLNVIRDMLRYADNAREAKIIIHNGEVSVDGVTRKDHRFPIGIMDVISIPTLGENYRVLPTKKGRLVLHPIDESEKDRKPCKILVKTSVRGGRTQLCLHDGTTLHLANEHDYRVGDTLLIELSSRKPIAHIPFKPGKLGLIVHGANVGRLFTVKEIKKFYGSQPPVVLGVDRDGREIETLVDYTFVLGDEKPVISLPGGVS